MARKGSLTLYILGVSCLLDQKGAICQLVDKSLRSRPNYDHHSHHCQADHIAW